MPVFSFCLGRKVKMVCEKSYVRENESRARAQNVIVCWRNCVWSGGLAKIWLRLVYDLMLITFKSR